MTAATTSATSFRPTNEEELAEAIRDARDPLCVRGGGTRSSGPFASGILLETGGLSGIRLYEPAALTMVAGAGTPLAEIEAALAAEGQRLAFEPIDHRRLLGTSGTPTLGGAVAVNASGPRRVVVGACRDHLLGVRFVDGTGTVISNGGRVMKNVTGYDLVKLMAGSRGRLGVLSEVSLKVLPTPGVEATLVLADLTPEQAVAAMSAALGSPFEVTGAARLPDGRTALRIEGFAGSVAYRADALARQLARFGSARRQNDEEGAALWREVRDVAPFHGRPGDVWRVSCRPSAAAGLMALAGGECLMDWGGALLWCLQPAGADLRETLGDFAGHARLVRADFAARAFATDPPEAPAVAALTLGLMRRFDPRGLFSGAPP